MKGLFLRPGGNRKSDMIVLVFDRSFGAKCSKCCRGISASDWVRKAREHVYHLACFACDSCKRQLSTGEEFALHEDRVLCKTHYLEILDGGSTSSDGELFFLSVLKGVVGAKAKNSTRTEELQEKKGGDCSWRANDTESERKKRNNGIQGQTKREEKRRVPERLERGRNWKKTAAGQEKARREQPFRRRLAALRREALTGANEPGELSFALCLRDGGDSEGYHKNKAKRVRTTFTEEQLQVLQANFQLDSNPDGQDLERIAQITGLSKRVTQVWFQNSRARQKKHLHTGKLKTPMHHPAGSITRDEGNTFGRHINLHLTYSFQSPQNAKSPVFVPRPISQSSSMDELSQDSTMMSCMRSEV
ncbi:hypothetical protein RUM43_002831 [Polyplax serrata]|uniref:LIM/homeobox protein Awh-like n=1 Tax=Polyplax serrata TaxID=468196 RepID=A0AAN8NZB2_POLSC